MASANSPVAIGPRTILQLDQTDLNNIYIGKAAPGTLTSASDWQIAKLSTSGGNISLLFAGGSPAYNHVWDNKASYSYS